MEDNTPQITQFVLPLSRTTFTEKDKLWYKVFIIILMMAFNLTVFFILKYYVLPLLLVKGTTGFFNAILAKITAIKNL